MDSENFSGEWVSSLRSLQVPTPRAEDIPTGWMNRPEPLEIDLGCHKGAFIVAMAQAWPEIRFLGIEHQRGRVARCRDKITRLGLTNAAVVHGEGLATLRDWLPPETASRIHVSFPDPWPKRRHHSRRLVSETFLREVWRALRPHGVLRLMTDDEPYFLAMNEAVSAVPGFSITPWDDGRKYPRTEFQRKFEAVGQMPYRIALERCSATASE